MDRLYLTRDQLEKLSTQRLLAYLKKNLRQFNVRDWYDSEDDRRSYEKVAAAWEKAYQDCKDILSTREHCTKTHKGV
jgi:hypothetical protein